LKYSVTQKLWVIDNSNNTYEFRVEKYIWNTN